MQVVGFCFPEKSLESGNDYIIKKHYNDGKTEEKTCEDFYKLGYKVSLRLMKQQDNSLVPVEIDQGKTDVPVLSG